MVTGIGAARATTARLRTREENATRDIDAGHARMAHLRRSVTTLDVAKPTVRRKTDPPGCGEDFADFGRVRRFAIPRRAEKRRQPDHAIEGARRGAPQATARERGLDTQHKPTELPLQTDVATSEKAVHVMTAGVGNTDQIDKSLEAPRAGELASGLRPAATAVNAEIKTGPVDADTCGLIFQATGLCRQCDYRTTNYGRRQCSPYATQHYIPQRIQTPYTHEVLTLHPRGTTP